MFSRTRIHTQFYFGITTVHRLILSVDVSEFNGNSKLLKTVQLSKFRKITVKVRGYTPKICWQYAGSPNCTAYFQKLQL